MPVTVGQMLDRYRLIVEIGSGSFGSVWLAEDTWLGNRVALKIPHETGEDLGKVLAEPKLLAGLEHPNIIKLYNVGKSGDTVFMVMEYVEGKSLKEILKGGALDKAEVLRITRSILDALSHAHAKGVVHRDLKPGNILVTESGEVKITDFGTAHALEKGDSTMAAGTLFYMPKEQLLGRVTPSSDLYSVGMMLYEMLSGKLPFQETDGNRLIQRILSAEAVPDLTQAGANVDPQLAAIVERAMRHDTRRRWASADEFIQAIDAYISGGSAPPEVEEIKLQHPVYDRLSKRVPRLADSFGRSHEFAFRTSVGGRGRGDGQFMLPAVVTVDSSGYLYVTDSVKSNVQIFDKDLRLVRSLGEEGGILDDGVRFMNPSGIAVDGKGNIYVCDTKNSRIQIIGPEGSIIKRFGRALIVVGMHEEKGVIGLNYPRGLAIDEEEGLLYVSDTGNHRLRLFSVEGKPVQALGGRGERPGEFDIPMGLALGRNGRLFAVDSQNYRIQSFDRGLRFRSTIGRRGTEPGSFYHPPLYACVNMFGELIVTDGSNRLHVFSEEGEFIGHIEPAERRKGAGARYHSPALLGSEDLFVVEEGGCEVEHFVYKERRG